MSFRKFWKTSLFKAREVACPAAFHVFVMIHRPRWPFKWGPFGGVKLIGVSGDEGEIDVYQADGGSMTADPVSLELFSRGCSVTTTVDFRGGSRLQRRTMRA